MSERPSQDVLRTKLVFLWDILIKRFLLILKKKHKSMLRFGQSISFHFNGKYLSLENTSHNNIKNVKVNNKFPTLPTPNKYILKPTTLKDSLQFQIQK